MGTRLYQQKKEYIINIEKQQQDLTVGNREKIKKFKYSCTKNLKLRTFDESIKDRNFQPLCGFCSGSRKIP